VDAKNGRSPDASGVWKLLELLSAMLDMPALRQNTLIVLAVHAELVPRLWYSYLKVQHREKNKEARHTVKTYDTQDDKADCFHCPKLSCNRFIGLKLVRCVRRVVLAGYAWSICMGAFQG
jgi:hypothetical protein